ncbi:MAG TPA: FAD-binding oxidoreductase [Actinomycetota bacterium]|nr:FAD-binding oxidoreductase [Actinomycetota bacterium]
MPTRASSELERLLPGRVLSGPETRPYARDMWPLQIARERADDELALPDAVVRPATPEDVCALLRWCTSHEVAAIAAGARSGVCGGVSVDRDALAGREVVALDMTSLTGVTVNERDMTATALAGTLGPEYEDVLDPHGLTAAHHPQSFDISTVGGWLACRSAGQFSTRYGKAEDLVSGLEVVTAAGERVSLGGHPASAAGPDMLRLFLGSEGALGVIVAATMRVVRSSPRRPRAFRYGSFTEGLDAVRRVVQEGLRPAVVRLYDPDDTVWSFPGQTGCVLVCVFEGPLAGAEEEAAAALLGGEDLGSGPAEHWLVHRHDAVRTFLDVMRPDGPLGPNAIVDTMEVAGGWSVIDRLYAGVRAALEPGSLGVLCHASHVYPDGACLYFTFAVQDTDEPGSRARYEGTWQRALQACVAEGGTITHHHGVGRLKARWLREELGEPGWTLLRSLKDALDPKGILNPGNLGL